MVNVGENERESGGVGTGTSQVRGVDLIAEERARQVESEGWSAEHDDEHDCFEMSMAAVCYAAPERIYIERHSAIGVSFFDPFPDDWSDKRFAYGERRDNPGNVPPDPDTYTRDERIDLLVKAGALIAAEIDRILRRKATP